MISVVCWLWAGVNLSGRQFLPAHVNVLGLMLKKHLPIDHRFICICDSSDGLASHVEWLETPERAKELGLLRTPEESHFPSCYRRLWSFSQEAAALGDMLLVVDIDLVVVRSIVHLFEGNEDFIGWRPYRDWGAPLRFGGGIYRLKPGARSFVWDDFKGEKSIKEARKAGYRGSDQAWLSYKLCAQKHATAKQETYWDKKAGLYSVRDLNAKFDLPKDACLIQFNGRQKPWQSSVPWVVEAWR